MEGFSPGVFGYKPAPSIWQNHLDISDDCSTSYVGNHFDAKGTKMAKFSLDSTFYTAERMIRLPYDDVQSLCNDWIPDWSARRDIAL
ncbi:hypothetical protein BOTCAL_0232g00090 [Botryotinia calthae]|uniref:Uncharacterized protein n=1 Tax=Botryotinia calthae TaxID=38488 RepID=A0A4Y8CXJ1_9HELO|nr:hypothetical protein BOTCAL_0232g00090 [Botryotinia calthae]